MNNYFTRKACGLFLSGFLFIFTACGGGKKPDGQALAHEVCECRKKAKGLSFSDPEARKIRMECSKLQGENWGKIIKNKEQEAAFNKRLNECVSDLAGQ